MLNPFELLGNIASAPSSAMAGYSGNGDLLLLSIRWYMSYYKGANCVEPTEHGGPWSEWWWGTEGYALLVILRITAPSPQHRTFNSSQKGNSKPKEEVLPGGGIRHQFSSAQILSQHVLQAPRPAGQNFEDIRLFRDDKGKIR